MLLQGWRGNGGVRAAVGRTESMATWPTPSLRSTGPAPDNCPQIYPPPPLARAPHDAFHPPSQIQPQSQQRAPATSRFPARACPGTTTPNRKERAPAGARRRPTMPREGDGSDEVADLWAMAAELERQFAGYKQRLAERDGGVSAHVDDDAAAASSCDEEAEPDGGDGDVRGRMYEAYVRRRDERLRQGWRDRMERKEAEVKAFWAQLELSTGRAGGGSGNGERATGGGGTATAGDEEGKTERDDDDKGRSSDAALAQKRITGKKHARTRSFSSSTNTAGRNRPDVVGRRRAQSQEPPPSEPRQPAGETSKESRARPAGGAATTKTAASRPRTALRRKNSVKVHQHGGAKQAGPKLLPRSLPQRASSGGLEDLGSREAVPPSADAAAPALRCSSYEQDSHGETSKDSSPPRPSVGGGGGTGQANAQTDSPGSDRSEVVDAAPDNGEPEAKNADVKKRGNEEVDSCSTDKLGNPNGDITSDSDVESSYVYINKDVVEEHATSVPDEPHAAPDFSLKKTNEDDAETTTAPAGAAATEIIATTRKAAEEAPAARESSGESSFSGSGRLGRSPPSSAAPSCSSRDQSIERVLEADAALLRKKREKQRAEKSALKTPGSARSRVSAGTARSPKETPKGFKRFLSFGKKNGGREVTVIDCTSPSVSSVADDDSGGWQSAGFIKPRMASSDAASDDTDHIGHATSPRACSLQSLVAASPAKSELAEIVPQVKSPTKAQRSFFSFRALNCGRG
ncbi:hypothetical protein QOZ80_2AG0148140 [Eleusine coracana subsp. coracana]|nr:hypothetical protein QOZ80_2AG0148140 [Eleusine coracana subsp. coracana]